MPRAVSRRLLRRLAPWALIGLPLVVTLLGLFDGVRDHADSYGGLPRAQQMTLAPWSSHWFHVIDPPGFVLGYSERLRNPLWVAYRLDEPRKGKIGARPGHFSEDAWTLMRVNADAYSNSGYDRGHMAPNYAMSRYVGRSAQLASFRMSNIVPQRPKLNQKLWQRLEEIETDVYAALPGPLWVVMGPVFDAQPEQLPSGVAIPSGFFRIWIRVDADGRQQALAFLVPQQVRGNEALDRYVVSVDEIEAQTGLDFFHRLDDSTEAELESQVEVEAWDFQKHARRQARY